MRQKFSDVSVVLGGTAKQNVPNLDVETRWNSMFLMIENCFKSKDILESLCNQEEFKECLEPIKLTEIDWRVLKSSKYFFGSSLPMYQCSKR